jgi:hypothetical protein
MLSVWLSSRMIKFGLLENLFDSLFGSQVNKYHRLRYIVGYNFYLNEKQFEAYFQISSFEEKNYEWMSA